VLAAEKGTCLLEAVSNDASAAMIAGRRERVDGAFEAVERVGLAVHRYLKCLVVVVATGFAHSHRVTLCQYIADRYSNRARSVL
jgi:hypothetical protein